MEKITKVRIQDPETGELSEKVPLGVAAENVIMSDGRTLEELIGDFRKYFGYKNLTEVLKDL